MRSAPQRTRGVHASLDRESGRGRGFGRHRWRRVQLELELVVVVWVERFGRTVLLLGERSELLLSRLDVLRQVRGEQQSRPVGLREGHELLERKLERVVVEQLLLRVQRQLLRLPRERRAPQVRQRGCVLLRAAIDALLVSPPRAGA
jgi:hypothetical protein